MTQISTSFNDLLHYRNDCDSLAALHGMPMLTFDWLRDCATAFHKDDTLFLIYLVHNGRLVALAPLYKSRDRAERHHLQLIGNRRLYEPGGLVYRDLPSLRLLIQSIRSTGYPVLLSRVPQDLNLADIYPRFSHRGLLHRMSATASQYLEFSDDFDAFESSLSSKRRYDLRRARRRAEKFGQLVCDIQETDRDNVYFLLQQAFAIENTGWKNESGTSIAQNRDLEEFFTQYFFQAATRKQAVICFLSIDSQPVACNLSIRFDNRLWILKIGYNPDYSSCSPGILLMHELIRYGLSQKLNGLEFLGCREQWIELWKPRQREYVSYLYYPPSWRGVRGLVKDAFCKLKNRIQ